MQEIWKDVVGYEGLYQVSNLGNVKSLNYKGTGQEQILRSELTNRGYLMVGLWDGNTQKLFTIHRLVARAFIENPGNKPHIDHINTIRTDNRAINLQWVTRAENMNNPLTKERCRISQLGKGNRAKKVICDGITYNSVKECAKFYNVRRTTMNHWLTGYHKMPGDFQAKGLKYIIEENDI